MLCLVFAVAGPVMPGSGDVSTMDPTMAYGAAPNMLVFAPDGGAGLGQDSFVEFLTSWNTTIAGPLGTSGAQNVIPPNPKGPMAVRATPLGRNGCVFEILEHRILDSCNNSTSGTPAAMDVSDAWVKHENCATDYGLNNGQEGEKKGSWRWGVLPMIVVVTHLGDLPTMRRWFGGSGYGIPINRYLWASFLLLICLPTTAAVTCRTCFDQIQGCTGGNDCPFVATTAQNGLLLGGVAAATATAIVARDVFPLRFTRVLTRGVLDSLLIIGRRPPPGTAVDVSALTNVELTDPVRTSGVELATILDEVTKRLGAATTNIELQRLNSISTTIGHKIKLGRGADGALAAGDGTSELVGVYRYCAMLAGKVVRTRLSQVATVMTPSAPQGDAQVKAVPPEKLVKPKSMAEFADILVTWTMLLSGLGIASILVSGAFLREVVFDTIADGTLPWEGAYELWLVYLEEVERTAGDDVNLSNVYNRGAQDTMIKRAMERLPNAGKGIFRPGGGGGDGNGDEEPKWNGSFNSKSAATCLTFNLGKKQHPANCLNEKGGCKFNHACDAYVSDKGPQGRCGSVKHGRHNCDNPAKVSKEQQ